jgi:hypothetical protein
VQRRNRKDDVRQEVEAVGDPAVGEHTVEQLNGSDLVRGEHQGHAQPKHYQRHAPHAGCRQEGQRSTDEDQIRRGKTEALTGSERVETGRHCQRAEHVGP